MSTSLHKFHAMHFTGSSGVSGGFALSRFLSGQPTDSSHSHAGFPGALTERGLCAFASETFRGITFAFICNGPGRITPRGVMKAEDQTVAGALAPGSVAGGCAVSGRDWSVFAYISRRRPLTRPDTGPFSPARDSGRVMAKDVYLRENLVCKV